MEVNEAIRNRYSIRTYSDKPVDRETIMSLLQSAWHAPCSCNLQLMQYIVVDNEEVRQKLARIATPKVLWAPTNILFLIDRRFTQNRHSAIMGLGAAMQNISLSALSQGLATCPMAGFGGDSKIKKMLGIPDELDLILILGVGYPKEEIKQRVRIPLEEVIQFNEYNSEHRVLSESAHLSAWSVQKVKNYRERIASVYRYGNRFRLHTYADTVYEHIAQLSSKYLKADGRCLDLFSYDGMYMKCAHEHNNRLVFITADYTAYTIHENRKLPFVVEGFEIDNENGIPLPDNSQDFITLIHKLQFTPDKKRLFREISRLMKDESRLVVTINQDNSLKRLVIILRRYFQKYILGVPFNVYENNPNYKIGPYKHISSKEINSLAKSVGLRKVADGIELINQKNNLNHRMYYAIFTK